MSHVSCLCAKPSKPPEPHIHLADSDTDRLIRHSEGTQKFAHFSKCRAIPAVFVLLRPWLCRLCEQIVVSALFCLRNNKTCCATNMPLYNNTPLRHHCLTKKLLSQAHGWAATALCHPRLRSQKPPPLPSTIVTLSHYVINIPASNSPHKLSTLCNDILRKKRYLIGLWFHLKSRQLVLFA